MKPVYYLSLLVKILYTYVLFPFQPQHPCAGILNSTLSAFCDHEEKILNGQFFKKAVQNILAEKSKKYENKLGDILLRY